MDPFAPVPFPQGGSGGDFGPSPVLRQVPVPYQGVLQPDVAGARRTKPRKCLHDGVPVERRLQEDGQVLGRTERDPIGMQGFGIHASRQQMGAVEKERVGQKQVEIGLIFGVERRSPGPFSSAVG